MKNILIVLVFSLLFVACKENSVAPKIITETVVKTDTVYVHQDTVKLQFQLNTDSSQPSYQYLVYTDFDGNGYSYQPVDETVYRGNYQIYYLQWTFLRSQVISNVAKFKIILHPTSGTDSILGIVYYYKD